MSATQLFTGTLVVLDCYKCGITFGMPEDFNKECLRDRSRSFSCPNGHSQYYIGETEAQKLRAQLAAEEGRTAALRSDLVRARELTERERRSHAATKGALTKLRKRIANGVCPECSRHFKNVQRHIECKHPELAERLAQ